jgi:endonuclease-3
VIDRILDRLRDRYGGPSVHRRLPPLDELVLTILSQNTSDTNCERAYASMRARFPEWADVRDADTGELEQVLRPGGLAAQKAPRIQAVLRELSGDGGPPRLDWAAELPPAEAMERLEALPGVGPKTASCVLLFSLDVPVMPVDTHVGRVARRLGLIAERMADGPAHAALTELVPDGRMLEAHLLFITHGRRICVARRPRCGECPLLDLCPYGRSALAGSPAPSHFRRCPGQ